MTGGLSDRARAALYGETATRNHSGGARIAGEALGIAAGIALGGAAAGSRTVQAGARALDAVGRAEELLAAGESIGDIARGCGDLGDWMNVAGAAAGGLPGPSANNAVPNSNAVPDVPPPNASSPPIGPFRGGRHGDTRLPVGDGLDSNHMPADSISPLPRQDGPAIQMDPSDHREMTSTGSSHEAVEWRARQQELIDQGGFREAQQMDIDDARNRFGDRYDEAIEQMLDYTDTLNLH